MTSLYKTLFFITISIVICGCYNEKDTKLTVRVRDISNDPLSGALVKIIAEDPIIEDSTDNSVNTDLNKESTTNSSGEATFDYTENYKAGQSGYAVFKVEVSNGNGGPVVSDVADVEAEKTSTIDIILPQ